MTNVIRSQNGHRHSTFAYTRYLFPIFFSFFRHTQVVTLIEMPMTRCQGNVMKDTQNLWGKTLAKESLRVLFCKLSL